jgi:hypothetical protein
MEENTFVEKIKQHRNKVILLAGIIVVVALVLLVPRFRNSVQNVVTNTPDETAMPEGCKPGYNFSETTGKPCPVPKNAPENQTAPSNESGYDAAIKAYAGKLITFGAGCSATPKDLSVAVGTRVMVTNHAKEPLNITFGDKTVSLRPYHYFTQSLSTKGTFSATCNGAPSATVTVR